MSNYFAFIMLIFLQSSMSMPGMENSVGFLSSGTSIEPKSTSESSPMVHGSLGGWTVMFHANAFLASIQQSGPRGGDKIFSSNWVMPMLARQFGGFAGGPVQLEASTFHGREPNENRWNIDRGKPDSFSSRLTIAPASDLTGQFSIGRINDREALESNLDTVRMTASVHHNREFASGHISSSLIWGRNKDLGHHGPRVFNAYTLESTVNFETNNWAWTRIENADREADHEMGEGQGARVQAYTFGYERDLPFRIPSVKIGLGAQVTTYGMPPHLKADYGNRPSSFVAFLRLRPAGNMAQHMRMMHGRQD